MVATYFISTTKFYLLHNNNFFNLHIISKKSKN